MDLAAGVPPRSDPGTEAQRIAAGTARLARILVPLDGSSLAEGVVGVAESLATTCRARVVLLHVLEQRAPTTVHGDRHLASVEEAEAYLREVGSRWGAQGGTEVESHVHPNPQGNVPKSIVEHAVDLNADLVVLSTHGAGGAQRALFGSVAQLVVKRGLRPVLLVRPLATSVRRSFMLKKILVPLDGTAPSEAALPLAGTLARAYGAELHFLRVVPTLGTLSGERAATGLLVPSATAVSLELEESEAKGQLTQLASAWNQHGWRASWTVRRGGPAHGIIDEALRLTPDMIVMATHGRAGLDALLSGSVASDIAGKLTQPILLVRIDSDSTRIDQ